MVCFLSFGQIFSDITHTLLSSPLNIYMYYHPCGETNNSKPMFINILHKIIYMLVYFL